MKHTPEEIRALSIIGRMRGRIKTAKKAAASRRNGLLGGRPRKDSGRPGTSGIKQTTNQKGHYEIRN